MINRKDIFINRAMEKYGDSCDYSLVKYVNCKSEIEIICKYHGLFRQTPEAHLRSGCSKCDHYHIDNDIFIKKSKLIHFNKYDYSLVEYIGSHDKVRIICKDHGIFHQRANSHYQGAGCPKCRGYNKTTGDFIKEAIEKYGSRFDYSKVNYIAVRTDITIICKKHGEFNITPSQHLRGVSCKKCSGSIGVNCISNFLEDKCISHKREKTIKGCLSPKNKLLQFDFYLPERDIYIEYDGGQHFKSVKFWGGKEGFEERKIRDKIKDDFCSKNGIKLYRISYLENIEERLKEVLDHKKISTF